MKLVVISPPMSLKNEPQLASEMIQAGLQHFHLRKPGGSLQDFQDYVRQLTTAERRHVVLHSRHELTEEWNLMVSTRNWLLPVIAVSLASLPHRKCGRTVDISQGSLDDLL